MPLISAHRGGCGVDGLAARERYRRAIELGVDFVEFDVRRSLDEVMVVCHDPCTASGRAVCELEYGALAEELAGEALTLAELLEIAGGKVGLHLDLKEPGYEAAVVEAALAHCPLERLVITSEDSVVKTIKERWPRVRAGLSLGEDLHGIRPWVAAGTRLSELFPARRLRACGADFVAVHQRLAGLNVLRYCERVGIPAWVWTVDEEPDIARFMKDSRVATLITNRPDVALRVRQRGDPRASDQPTTT
ncbi:MAG TPA: glycerophosphodiester phosphodiesterase [Candidatus Dormibacteraeota bacterium]